MKRAGWLLPVLVLLAGCWPDSPDPDGAPPLGTLTLQPATPGADVAPYLSHCLYDHGGQDPPPECTLHNMPLLGMRAPVLDVDLVMEHVLVEKAWMAQHFRDVLDAMPPELLQLFRSTTGIVIASDIRPSHYRSVTAAVYLDPANLWLTQGQFLETPQFPDFRSNFGADLQFRTLWRYVSDNEYAYRSGRSYNGDRTFNDIYLGTATLLVHELAHAADYIPPAHAVSAHPSQTPADLVRGLYSLREVCLPICRGEWMPPVSAALVDTYPLHSEILKRTASIRFHGEQAQAHDIALLPDDIAYAFSVDRANDHYNYSTPREDVAMAFEELASGYYLGLQRDLGVSDNPDVENPGASDYTVYWGQRGRIAEPQVLERALLVAQYLLPELDAAAAHASLPDVIQMPPGRTWLENLEIQADGRLKQDSKRKRELRARDVREDAAPRGHVQ